MNEISNINRVKPFRNPPFDYQGLVLTGAVNSFDDEVLMQGYKRTSYVDNKIGISIPCIMLACNENKLMDLFFDLIDELGNNVRVVLESSHEREDGTHVDFFSEEIETVILKSYLTEKEYENLILRDGYTGIAVVGKYEEVQLDEHKNVVIYSSDLSRFEAIIRNYGLANRQGMNFVNNYYHEHHTSPDGYETFCRLRKLLDASA